MSIIFVKSLFCPNNQYFNITYNSITNNIESILSSLSIIKKFGDIKIIFIGWVSNEFREIISNFCSIFINIIDVQYIFWDDNHGKIKLYYDVFSGLADKLILYSDHDIIMNTNFWDCLENVNKIMSDESDFGLFGLLALNQLEDCRHHCTNDCVQKIIHNENILIAHHDDIAGGCFFIKNDTYINPPFYHVYGFDEKYISLCIQGKKTGILLNRYITHPYANDEITYKKWKINNIIRSLQNYDTKTINEYNNDILISKSIFTT